MAINKTSVVLQIQNIEKKLNLIKEMEQLDNESARELVKIGNGLYRDIIVKRKSEINVEENLYEKIEDGLSNFIIKDNFIKTGNLLTVSCKGNSYRNKEFRVILAQREGLEDGYVLLNIKPFSWR